ncbi:hypothetical protein Tco_0927271, partial [Tanacetum coccineum]
MTADPTTNAESPPVAVMIAQGDRHTRLGSLKVLAYEGVKMTPSYSKPITKIGELLIVLTSYDVLKVLTADIVLTTYDVLREDLNHDNDRREVYHHLMRYPKSTVVTLALRTTSDLPFYTTHDRVLCPLVRGTMAGVDVNNLTMEQYLALSRENQEPGVVKPKIRGNVNFEINSQFMRELREDALSGNKDEDAHDHIDQMGGQTLPGNYQYLGSPQKSFIQRYCPLFMTSKQLEDIHNFNKKEMNHYTRPGRGTYPWDETSPSSHSDSDHGWPFLKMARLNNEQEDWKQLDAKFEKDLTSTRIVPSMRKLNKLKRSDMENSDEQHHLTRIMEESF